MGSEFEKIKVREAKTGNIKFFPAKFALNEAYMKATGHVIDLPASDSKEVLVAIAENITQPEIKSKPGRKPNKK